MTDDELNRLADDDPIAALCYLVAEAGGVMRLHGKPVTCKQLRQQCLLSATERILKATGHLP